MFFDELNLPPVSRSAKTGAPSCDKAFRKHYLRDYEEVALFAEYQSITKLVGTYIKGWNTKIFESLDSSSDHCLRASYFFFRIISGRLGSMNPNLQQIPSRGDPFKIKAIKRAFIAKKGCLCIRFDYSAHEIRGWGMIAREGILAEAFRVGQKLRQRYIKTSAYGSVTDIVKAEAELARLKKQLAQLESET